MAVHPGRVIPLRWSSGRRGWGSAAAPSPGIPTPHPIGMCLAPTALSPPGPALLRAGQHWPSNAQGHIFLHTSLSLSVAISAGAGAGCLIPPHSCHPVLQMLVGCQTWGDPQGFQTKCGPPMGAVTTVSNGPRVIRSRCLVFCSLGYDKGTVTALLPVMPLVFSQLIEFREISSQQCQSMNPVLSAPPTPPRPLGWIWAKGKIEFAAIFIGI